MSKEMKDSGIEWIGEIPIDWDVIKLRHCLTTPITDGPHETPNYVDEGVPFISVNAIDENGNISRDVKTRISLEDAKLYNEKTDLSVGDILFTKSATIGKVAVVDKVDFMVWSPIAVIKPNNEVIDSRFLKFIFLSSGYLEQVKNLGTRSTQVNVGMRAMERARIPLANLATQNKIVNLLTTVIKKTNKLLRDTQQSIEQLKEYKQSLITESVTKGLDPNVKLKDSGIEWLGEIPVHWKVNKIKFVTKINEKKVEFNKGETYVGLENVVSYTGKLNNYGKLSADSRQSSFEKGNVLYSKLRPYLAKAFIADTSGSCSSEFIVFNNFMGKKRYLLYWLISQTFTDFINATSYGAKMPRSSWEYIKETVIPRPPIKEEHKIVSYLDEQTSRIDKLIEDKTKVIEELENYKNSLIYEYVTGKKEV